MRHGTLSFSTNTSIDYCKVFEDFQPYNKTKGEYDLSAVDPQRRSCAMPGRPSWRGGRHHSFWFCWRHLETQGLGVWGFSPTYHWVLFVSLWLEGHSGIKSLYPLSLCQPEWKSWEVDTQKKSHKLWWELAYLPPFPIAFCFWAVPPSTWSPEE